MTVRVQSQPTWFQSLCSSDHRCLESSRGLRSDHGTHRKAGLSGQRLRFSCTVRGEAQGEGNGLRVLTQVWGDPKDHGSDVINICHLPGTSPIVSDKGVLAAPQGKNYCLHLMDE